MSYLSVTHKEGTVKRLIKSSSFALLSIFLLAGCVTKTEEDAEQKQSSQQRPPIIDMHLHAQAAIWMDTLPQFPWPAIGP